MPVPKTCSQTLKRSSLLRIGQTGFYWFERRTQFYRFFLSPVGRRDPFLSWGRRRKHFTVVIYERSTLLYSTNPSAELMRSNAALFLNRLAKYRCEQSPSETALLVQSVIAIDDNQTSNLLSIYVKSEQVKWKGELGREGRKRDRATD